MDRDKLINMLKMRSYGIDNDRLSLSDTIELINSIPETNFEHNECVLRKLNDDKMLFAVTVDDEVIPCSMTTGAGNDKCRICKFSEFNGCNKARINWLLTEYKPRHIIDWTKVPVDTPILVTGGNEMNLPRHFAKYENGEVYAWDDGRTSHTTISCSPWKYVELRTYNPDWEKEL